MAAHPYTVAISRSASEEAAHVLRADVQDVEPLSQGEQQVRVVLGQCPGRAGGFHCGGQVASACRGEHAQVRLAVLAEVRAHHRQRLGCPFVVASRIAGQDHLAYLLAQRHRPGVAHDQATQPGQHEVADLLAGPGAEPVVLAQVLGAAVGQGDERLQDRRVADLMPAVPPAPP
jgi:hypothetical protein